MRLSILRAASASGRTRNTSTTSTIESIPAKAPVFHAAARRYLPGLEGATLVPDYAGIRPKLAGPGQGFRDFVIEEASPHAAPGFIACIGIESPGLTAALAIGERVAALARP